MRKIADVRKSWTGFSSDTVSLDPPRIMADLGLDLTRLMTVLPGGIEPEVPHGPKVSIVGCGSVGASHSPMQSQSVQLHARSRSSVHAHSAMWMYTRAPSTSTPVPEPPD